MMAHYLLLQFLQPRSYWILTRPKSKAGGSGEWPILRRLACRPQNICRHNRPIHWPLSCRQVLAAEQLMQYDLQPAKGLPR